jgi:UDP-GlcNAc:undecaprenyl-phosphate GlcNAc-1-phosphate transferase
MPVETTEVLGAGVVGAVGGLLCTPLAAAVARRLGLLDRPGGYKAHAAPTPLLGGAAIAVATVAGAASCWPSTDAAGGVGPAALAAGATVVLGVGLLDDLRGLTARHKFAWQVVAAAVAGLVLALLGVRLSLFLPWPPAPIIALTVLWIVAITNAVNFLDNMNGLCAGLGAIAALALCALNLRAPEPAVAVIAAALAGACLGFLPFNWPRARIFLGDSGSMLIGFLLAALSVMGVYTRGAPVPLLAVYAPLCLLAVPLLDLVLVTLLRLWVGHPPWIGDRRHISHRLVRRGMRPATAVATLWAASAAAGLGAVLLPTVGAAQAPLLLALLACALGALAAAAGTRGLE